MLMRKQLLLLCAIGAVLSGTSQEVVASGGGNHTNTNASISYTVGEPVIFTGTDGSNDLTQGFQQTNWNFVSVEDYNSNYDVSIYPNPAQEQLNINTDKYDKVEYLLINASGQVVSSGKLVSSNTSINVANLAMGEYSLVLKKENEKLKNYNIIKTK